MTAFHVFPPLFRPVGRAGFGLLISPMLHGGDVPLFSFLLERGKWGRPARPPGWGHVRMRLDGVRGVVFEAG